ncbi:MAG: peptidylprolyl isomerase [Planctomycetota bacterium]
MLRALLAAVAVAACLTPTAQSQTIRFDTSVGDFDMVLNPTDNPALQPLVDNILAYVGTGRYHYAAINRAVDGEDDDPSNDFVLQMGGFLGLPTNPDLWVSNLQSIEALDPVIVDSDGDGAVDFDALSNTRGTVSLALSAGNVNSGTSSFFVNLGDNSALDAQGFVPFAEVPDMTTVDTILQLMQQNLVPGNLALSDVPITENGKIVVIERVFLLDADPGFTFAGPISRVLGDQDSGGVVAATSTASIDGGSGSSSLAASNVTPEPGAAALAFTVLASLPRRRRR